MASQTETPNLAHVAVNVRLVLIAHAIEDAPLKELLEESKTGKPLPLHHQRLIEAGIEFQKYARAFFLSEKRGWSI